MKRQPSPSPVHFSNPPFEDSPPPFPSGDHANVESEHIDVLMASPNHLHKEAEESSTGDEPSQANTGINL